MYIYVHITYIYKFYFVLRTKNSSIECVLLFCRSLLPPELGTKNKVLILSFASFKAA